MHPQLLKVSKGLNDSFSIRRDQEPDVNNKWHYHPEIELVHFKSGKGMQFVGDSIKKFGVGNMVIIGANLPHYWKFDDEYFTDNDQYTADISVSHFNKKFWGEQFLHLPENNDLKLVLEKANRGLLISGETQIKVAAILDKLEIAKGTLRIILLIEALSVIAQGGDDLEELASVGFKPDICGIESDRISAIFQFTQENFHRRIELKEVAEVANMSQHSFCRYFKSRTGKTYSKFLIELRVSHACKLLIENHLCLKQLCYASGFNNFTSFHKYFKMITGRSPLIYQREFIRKVSM